MFGNARPFGFLSGRAQDAEEFIGETEQIVSSLSSTEADLRPAKEALHAAKELLTAQAYAKAVAQAKRAAALATTLTARFNAYVAAWNVVRSCREELERLGFPTASLDDALSAADRETVRTVEEDGTLVPNYHGAAAILRRATAEAQSLVARAREASREVFLATLAVAALSDSPTSQVPSWLAVRLEGMVEGATRELALGRAPEAARMASEARVRADDALAGAARTWELLDLAAAVMDGLEAPGRAADALVERVESARDALARGFLDRTTAAEVARRLSDEAAAFARQYPRARTILDRAERVYARLQRDGFSSYDVDLALSEARRALEAGDWAGVKERVGRASATYVRLRKEQEELTKAIGEIDERANLLKDFRLPLIPHVLEILARAKEEARSGRLSGANEDLLLANALMQQATRTGS